MYPRSKFGSTTLDHSRAEPRTLVRMSNAAVHLCRGKKSTESHLGYRIPMEFGGYKELRGLTNSLGKYSNIIIYIYIYMLYIHTYLYNFIYTYIYICAVPWCETGPPCGRTARPRPCATPSIFAFSASSGFLLTFLLSVSRDQMVWSWCWKIRSKPWTIMVLIAVAVPREAHLHIP